MKEDDTCLFYTFNTAWSAPWPVLMELAKQFSELKFEIIIDYEDCYGEPSQRIIVKEGKLVSYEEIEHIYEEDEEWKEADLEESSARKWLCELLETDLR